MKDLHPQKDTAQGQHEDVSAQIMASFPGSADGSTGGAGDDTGILMADSARQEKDTIDEGGTEEPARDDDPPDGRERVPKQTLDATRGQDGDGAGMCEEKDDEGKRHPKPAELGEEDVEDVALLRKVRRGERRGMRSDGGIVWRSASGGIDDREERTKEQRRGIRG